MCGHSYTVESNFSKGDLKIAVQMTMCLTEDETGDSFAKNVLARFYLIQDGYYCIVVNIMNAAQGQRGHM